MVNVRLERAEFMGAHGGSDSEDFSDDVSSTSSGESSGATSELGSGADFGTDDDDDADFDGAPPFIQRTLPSSAGEEGKSNIFSCCSMLSPMQSNNLPCHLQGGLL